ncbi:hypothetical protein C8Q74DRAFT_1296319 [Fomes fomentarius]|nr:hypothetical protein C8Q74DRAFT_1296319 [Fomes fomentarius]
MFPSLDGRGDWRLPTPKEMKEELMGEFSEEERLKVWSAAAEAVKIHHDELVARWKEEMDTLLVYAGLISAILTAFNIQSYQMLQPSPTDSTVAVLQQISTQLASFSINPTFVNSTHHPQALSDLQPPFHASLSAVWINMLWFCSLVFSLAAASIALVVKQWLHSETVGLSGTSREIARLRQHRLNGLRKWRVGSIVVALPILLQAALGLFLGGIVILLWTLHGIVAAVTSSLVGGLFTFLVTVTVLPVIRWDCSYRSPQASATYTIVRLINDVIRCICDRLFWTLRTVSRRSVQVRDRIASTALPVVVWVRRGFREMPTWHGRDHIAIARDPGLIDRGIVTTAYTATLSPSYLDRLHVILPDFPQDQLNTTLQEIWSAFQLHWGGLYGPEYAHWLKNVRMLELTALYAARHMATIEESDRGDNWRCCMKAILDKFVASHDPDRCDSTLFISTMTPLALGTTDVAWAASDIVAKVWMFSTVCENDMPSYSIIRSVMLVFQWRLKHWKAEEYTGDNLLAWLRGAGCVLLCISRSQSSNTISVSQLETICAIGRSILLAFEDLLGEQEWTRLKPEKTEALRGRQDMWPGIFPHRLSSMLETWVIKPLLLIADEKRIRAAIPSSLPLTLQQAWSVVQCDFPSPVGRDIVDSIPLFTSIDTIAFNLDNLTSTLNSTANDNGNGQSVGSHIQVVCT